MILNQPRYTTKIALEIAQQKFIELIETIIVCKFPHKIREKIEQLFGFQLKFTKT